jgi:hypothetical protein
MPTASKNLEVSQVPIAHVCVILTTLEADIGRIKVGGQCRKRVIKTLSQHIPQCSGSARYHNYVGG